MSENENKDLIPEGDKNENSEIESDTDEEQIGLDIPQ
jgi:hypothetical protein